MQKIKIDHRAKFRDRDNFFSAAFISVSGDFTLCFHFRCVARATFDRNLIYSADACFLVMACVGYSRAQLKTLSSLLKSTHREYLLLSFVYHSKTEQPCSSNSLETATHYGQSIRAIAMQSHLYPY